MKNWIVAFRLRTLPLALSSILMGSFLAYFRGLFNPVVAGLCVLTTIFLQITSNLANDYGDSKNGADHQGRKGPARMVQSGQISSKQMKIAMIIGLVFSFISGFSLLIIALGWNVELLGFFLLLGVGSMVAAVAYTVGKRPYGYAGLGDISVLIFFGFVGVMGTYFLQVKTLDVHLIFPSLSCGLLSVGVLNLNNVRDIESDKVAGKLSVPVRLGRQNAIVYHWILLLLSIGSAVYFTWMEYSNVAQWMFLFSIPLILLNGKKLQKSTQTEEVDPLLKQLALSTLLFVITFGLGLIIKI